MCGIFGCISKQPQDLINNTLQGLKILEYRGYDSAGIAYNSSNKNDIALKVIKSIGEVEKLSNKIKERPITNICIGHTRWATNGIVNTDNSHPHLSFNQEIAVVHNGIIENYEACRKHLEAHGIKLKTPVDTEVIPNILYLLQDNKHNIHNILQGQYVFCATEGNKLFLAKKGNLPLIIGRNKNTIFVTSDTLALPQDVSEIITLNDLDTCEIIDNETVFFNQAKPNKRHWIPFNQSYTISNKNNFSTYMEKEINEIPNIIQNIFDAYQNNQYIIDLKQQFQNLIKKVECIHICGCGTSYHAAKIIAQIFERDLKIRSIAHISSELTKTTLLNQKALAIVISQSGETADTLACMNILEQLKVPIVALCNVATSAIAQRSCLTFPLLCGPEIAVASTKVFCATLLVGCLIAKEYSKNCQNHLKKLIHHTLKNAREILPLPQKHPQKIFVIGKEIAYNLALETALKIKEVSYLHCEGFSANELKHGPLSLVDENTLTIAIGEKVTNAIAETKSRGGQIAHIPNYDNPLGFICQIIPAQIFALDLALSLGINPDKPRNLAKSVTVL